MDDNKKRFLQIVQQLRELIEEENIQPGDKLPSERVLTERLEVGRSSVREALRSLELLGLIETKHGGGTFLTNSQHHKLVDVVGSFILTNDQSLKEIYIIRQLHEREAIRVLCTEKHDELSTLWDSLFEQVELEKPLERSEILKEIIVLSGNRLSLKMWLHISSYCYRDLRQQITPEEKIHVLTMIKAIQMHYLKEALDAYNHWIAYFSTDEKL